MTTDAPDRGVVRVYVSTGSPWLRPAYWLSLVLLGASAALLVLSFFDRVHPVLSLYSAIGAAICRYVVSRLGWRLSVNVENAAINMKRKR